MTTGFRNSSGVDFDSLFDPYVQGTSPAATGLRLSSGVDLAGRYAPISFGTKGPDVGFRTSGGVDVSNLWAAFGTAGYSLPVDGQTYSAVSGRGTGRLTFEMSSAGTYRILSQINGTTSTTLASGTWLPSGGTVSDYSCMYAFTQTTNVVSNGGTNTNTNDASTASALTTTRNFVAESSAPLVNQFAHQELTLVLTIYKNGMAFSVTTVYFNTSGDGQ